MSNTFIIRNLHLDDTQVWITEVGDDRAAAGESGQATHLDGIWDLLADQCASAPLSDRIPVMVVYRLVDDDGVDGSKQMGVMRQGQNALIHKLAYSTLESDWLTPPSC
jgi:hypothetical protein